MGRQDGWVLRRYHRVREKKLKIPVTLWDGGICTVFAANKGIGVPALLRRLRGGDRDGFFVFRMSERAFADESISARGRFGRGPVLFCL